MTSPTESGPVISTDDELAVIRRTELPAPVDAVREALLDPELLSTWLGPWSVTGDTTATVVTDDGRRRSVIDHHVDRDGNVRWSWSFDDQPDSLSEVTVVLSPVGDRTELTVRESATRRIPGATASVAAGAGTREPGVVSVLDRSSVRWTGCLLALGAMLAARQLATV